MLLTLRGDLLLVSAAMTYRGATIEIPAVLVDTGAASTVVNADLADAVGIRASRGDDLLTFA